MDDITYINSLSECKGDTYKILIGRLIRQHRETISLLNSEKLSYPNFDYEPWKGLSCIFDGLEGFDRVLFRLEAISVKSSEELEGNQLLVKGMTASEIIVNGKWIRR